MNYLLNVQIKLYNMKTSKQIKDFYNELKFTDLLRFAKTAGNEQLYIDLIKNKKSIKQISEELNLKKEYEDYLKFCENSPKQSLQDRVDRTFNYRYFLREKICFPNGLNDKIVDKILNGKIWHYGFYILPKRDFQFSNANSNLKKNKDGLFDDRIFWKKENSEISFFNEIVDILPFGDSLSPQIILYGHEKDNHVIINHENDIVQGVIFRINLASKYDTILERVIEFCHSKELILVDKKLNILPLDFFVIKNMMEISEEFLEYQTSLVK